MSETRPTSFLDLSPEVRQMVYTFVLPTDRVMRFPATQQRVEAEKTIDALCATGLGIYEEVEDTVLKECSAHIVVSPHRESGLPSAMEWWRFQGITVEIAQPQDDDVHDRAGVREVICRLKYGRPESLPDLRILFRDDSEEITSFGLFVGDAKWTQDRPARSFYCWDERSGGRYDRYPFPADEDLEFEDDEDDDDYRYAKYVLSDENQEEPWLRTTNDCYQNPIVVEILDRFLALPPCKSAYVQRLRGLDERRSHLPRYDPERRIFDGDYLDDLCGALELWLKGKREAIEPPRVGDDFGETALERLAYRWCGGRLYCDGGLEMTPEAC